MPNLRDAIRGVMRDDADESRRAAIIEATQTLRFAYAERVDTLYKFKSLTGDGCSHVQDIIENSRLYFSTQEQFNDPLDCAPVFKLAGDPNHPAFMAEMRADEDQMILEQKLTPEEVEKLRATQGTPATEMAEAVMQNLRADLRRTLHMFCFSSKRDHPLMWSHYAASHSGICLHFKVDSGLLTGVARGVDYVSTRPPVLVPLRYNTSDMDVAKMMSLVKADFWCYESEYRILAISGTDWGHKLEGRYVSFAPEMLTGITLGMCLPAVDRNIVLSMARNRSIPLQVWEAFEDQEKFAVKFRQIA